MAASPSLQRCSSMSHISRDNSFKCDPGSPVHGENIEPENEIKRSHAKFRLNRSQSVLHKQFQKQILLHSSSKAFNRRRFTFSSHSEYKVLCKKRRRYTSIALPTKFLLGGNIKDPLNLGSLEDEKINQQLNAFSPASSPLPVSQHRTQVKLLIPPNIYDPLNLNTGEEIEFNLLSSKHRKRRRHRKNRREEGENSVEVHQTSAKGSDSDVMPISKSPTLSLSLEDCAPKELKLDCSISLNSSDERALSDKIVSPVVPQGSLKFHKPAVKPITKRRRTKSRLLQKVETKKYRANAEKFCYGNHVTNHANWNFGNDTDEDPRLRFFSKDLFYRKDVLDIGCNTGILTLHIAKQWYPRKIIGIDIDKKLINIAQRKVRSYSNRDLDKGINFPQSMAAMYGTLSKFNISNLDSSSEFPNNVTFFEANYVPGCEEYLETQKPEFDTILCLRVTKWIHLNFGDEGLKMAFKRMFAQLRTGGHLILEPQPWFTYSASKRITPSIYKTYCSLNMKPDAFCDFLLSKEVGFSSCELIGRTYNCTKVYRQPLYLLTKGFSVDEPRVLHMRVLSFHNDEWNNNADEQSEAASDWPELEALNHITVTNSNVEY
ncbi:probable RNA methyltransferase Y17G7B.18 [Uloborus diversus]|uniref:probable RNA methyltransferase Y17G7B.18 n=1 Tax=Uloborus diversus TaxID=327109 RepID=UPI00240914E2|nr:probable RNA methyltransferase Y17G7B.18 [Uloborus diversus]